MSKLSDENKPEPIFSAKNVEEFNRLPPESQKKVLNALAKTSLLMIKKRNLLKAWSPEKIISGGQTGVDRAALDVAMKLDIKSGGYCPKGRKAEDGPIPERYSLIELSSQSYRLRTERNIIESDGTLIINRGPLVGGSLLTFDLSLKNAKPVVIVPLETPDFKDVRSWGNANKIQVLNIAGPSEGRLPEGIYEEAYSYLLELFSRE